jgi:hypothetical protein
VPAVAEDDGERDRGDEIDEREVHRVQDHGPHVRLAVFLRDLAEVGDVPLLAGERLHDAHAGDVLRERRCDESEPLADGRIRASGVDPEQDRADAHHGDHGERGEGQPPVEHEQQDRRSDQRQRALHERRDAVGDELVEGLDVIRQPADDHAGTVTLEEAKREPLQVAEELHPQVGEDPFADPAGQVRLHVAHAPVGEPGKQEHADDQPERAEIVVADPVVDRVLREEGWQERGRRCQEEREDREDRPRPVGRREPGERRKPPAGAPPGPVLDLGAPLHRQMAPGLPDPHRARPFAGLRALPRPGGGEVHPPPAVSVSPKGARFCDGLAPKR